MKTLKLTIIAFALILTASASAQNAERKSTRPTFSAEEMTAQRASRLVQDLGLDDATAAKFTDIYKRYAKDQEALRPKRDAKKDNKKADNKEAKKPAFKTPTDAEVDAQNKERFAQQRKALDLQERYYNEFRGILSARQTNKVMNQRQGQAGRQGFQGPRGNFGPQQNHQSFRPQQGQQNRHGFQGPRGNFGPQQGQQFGGPRQFPGHRSDSIKAGDKNDNKKDAKKETSKDSKKNKK